MAKRPLTAAMADALLTELTHHPVFDRHGERVAELTLRACAAHGVPVDEDVVRWAARFHDIMVLRSFRHAPWSSTYVEESAELARVWLTERTGFGAARIQLAVDCIRHHHDLRRHPDPVVDAFRRADWSEVSGGLFTAGLPRAELTALRARHPAHGFLPALAGLLLRFTIRPLNLIRIFWPRRTRKVLAMRMIYLIVSQSVLWAAASALLLIWPHAVFALFGMELSPTSGALARVFGSELTGLTLASYFTRHLVYGPRRKHLALAYTASNTLGFVVTLIALQVGSMTRFTWVLCGLYFAYAVGFAYFRFADKTVYEQRIEGAHGLVT